MSKLLGLIIIVVLLVVMAFVVPKAWQAITAPWSLGSPTLTNTWAGSTQAKLGSEYGLYIDLDYRSLDISGGTGRRRSRGRSNRPNLEGTATLCTPKGERYDYEVSGKADRSGKIEVLYVEYGDPALSALNLQLRGDWKPDTLTLSTDKNPFMPDGSFVFPRSVSSADPDDSFAPITFTDHNRQTFEDICARIRK